MQPVIAPASESFGLNGVANWNITICDPLLTRMKYGARVVWLNWLMLDALPSAGPRKAFVVLLRGN